MPGWIPSLLTSIVVLPDQQNIPKTCIDRCLKALKIWMISFWQESRKLSKTLTFRYDKMIYLVEPTEENTRIAGEKITVYDYPNGTLAFKYGYRSLNYQVFDKLECIDQGQIVDNKRLGAVLKLAQDKMDELDREGKRDRSKKMPKRRAQARVQEQLRAINPVLANPEEFRASLKR
ncbi:Putative transposase (identified by ISEscan HMM) [Klebsiella pneumoniae]|nr:Putative transposase (identified by ISEscan HMM) [Klebsiella pneumoniae]